ncbi:Ribonuclease 3 [Phytophthora megakarya]|uniref:Ribonuclease 3 n=1 Tax=Phytophthora megakarya TaxID=4795 RepID=A0A225UX40_9STRA|nr:Ribonuclease 3 [Phytophthora megakarya]
MSVKEGIATGTSEKSSNQTAAKDERKLERYILDKDIAGTTTTTTQQLLYPKCTPDWQLIKPEHFEKVDTPANWESNLIKFQQRIGVNFKDMTLLKIALTHHGCLQNNVVPDDVPVVRLSNRSLEFLGDSLLGMAAASTLFQMKPWYQEGQLSRTKSALVNNITLAKISADLGITFVMLWPAVFKTKALPDEPNDDKGRTTIAAGAVESLIAAIYLDQGMVAAMEFLASYVLPLSVKYATQETIWDPVIELQSLLLAQNRGIPVYKHLPSTDSTPAFTIELFVQEKSILKAQASSYKLAKCNAAEDAYVLFKESLSITP